MKTSALLPTHGFLMINHRPLKERLGKPFSTHCSKSSFFVQKSSFDFPRKLSIFFGWKTREIVVVLDFLAVDNFDFTRKMVKKNLGKKLVKMLGFCQNWIFGQKFDFSNSVLLTISRTGLNWTVKTLKTSVMMTVKGVELRRLLLLQWWKSCVIKLELVECQKLIFGFTWDFGNYPDYKDYWNC